MSQRNSDLHNDLGAADAELARCLAQTLQHSSDVLDADTRARLATMRHRALMRTRRQRVAGAVALAASVLAVAAMPWMLRQQAHESAQEDSAYLSVDPEMLADMDMLMAIGESR